MPGVYASEFLHVIKSGFLISEFLLSDPFSVDVERGTFRGGLKTEAGFDRIVPIHPICVSFVKRRLAQSGERMVCKKDGTAMTDDYFGNIATIPHWNNLAFAA